MAKTVSYFATLVLILVAIQVCDVTSDQCEDQREALIGDCTMFVIKGSYATPFPPSQQCCTTIQKSDWTCPCKLVNSELRKYISMEKVIALNKFCGRPLKPGSKCGDYVIPMPSPAPSPS
ncbi:putative lipid-transfer protein DIR1 [Ananas comosus]|uniref:Lipid-transfer protein DIR1 n=1 Tax=Ananas comosus TaxID=4615 RepID=A0A6P5F3Y0_ANACO|nr:putative lipid-transfer protein DIR1 [Ananas comosus]